MQSARSLVSVLLLGATLSACGGAKNADVARLGETEPNDSSGLATPVTRNWSSLHLGGTCDTASDEDWWAITFATFVPPAPLQATLKWTGSADLTLFLYDTAGALISSDGSTTSPDVVSSTLTTSGAFTVRVKCTGAAGTIWKLDIPAPGANPSE